MSKKTKQSGMPIYLDKTGREMADPLDELEVDGWFPSNSAAHKLWRCLESMRDLDELLEDSGTSKTATKKKRRLKIAITPLYSLVRSIDDLCNDIKCNERTRGTLDKEKVQEVSKIQKKFSDLLPHDNNAEISTVRNKLSSHIDKKLQPYNARQVSGAITPSEFGRWLHLCLHIALDLTKLDIYQWSCNAPSNEYISFMHNEPFIVTIKPDGPNGAELAGVNIAHNSPRNSISEVIERLIRHSQWMFKKGQPRIGSLKEDKKENWNTFKNYAHIHEKTSNK